MPAAALDPIALSPLVVVFDYGEVISHSPSAADRAALLERAGVDAARFEHAYWAHRAPLDAGTATIAEYWRRVAADVGADWDEVDIAELWALDHRSWLSVDAGTLRLLAALRAGGTRLALLSNAGEDFSGWLRAGAFAPYFERVFVSGELRLVKPHAPIYEHVIAELGIAPSQFFFVDNKAENVAGARAVGGDGHVFVGADDLEARLRSLV